MRQRKEARAVRRGKEPVDAGADEKCDRGRLAREKERGRKKGSGKYRKEGETKESERS